MPGPETLKANPGLKPMPYGDPKGLLANNAELMRRKHADPEDPDSWLMSIGWDTLGEMFEMGDDDGELESYVEGLLRDYLPEEPIINCVEDLCSVMKIPMRDLMAKLSWRTNMKWNWDEDNYYDAIELVIPNYLNQFDFEREWILGGGLHVPAGSTYIFQADLHQIDVYKQLLKTSGDQAWASLTPDQQYGAGAFRYLPKLQEYARGSKVTIADRTRTNKLLRDSFGKDRPAETPQDYPRSKTASTPVIRKMKPKELASAIHVAHQCFTLDMSEEYMAEIIHDELGTNLSRCYVATDHDKIIGGYLISMDGLGPGNEKELELKGPGAQGVILFLLPEYRGRGIGRELRELPRKLGLSYIYGCHYRELGNLKNWTDYGREVIGENEMVYYTLMRYKK
jgi:GNAT superfamily N-acetyltransferase